MLRSNPLYVLEQTIKCNSQCFNATESRTKDTQAVQSQTCIHCTVVPNSPTNEQQLPNRHSCETCTTPRLHASNERKRGETHQMCDKLPNTPAGIVIHRFVDYAVVQRHHWLAVHRQSSRDHLAGVCHVQPAVVSFYDSQRLQGVLSAFCSSTARTTKLLPYFSAVCQARQIATSNAVAANAAPDYPQHLGSGRWQVATFHTFYAPSTKNKQELLLDVACLNHDGF